jgi:hypothetical protein
LLVKEVAYAKKHYHEELRGAATLSDYGHGRIEDRSLVALTVSPDIFSFPGIQQIAQLTRVRTMLKSGRVQREVIYVITNCPPEELNAEELLQKKRDHWLIENRVHYIKDDTFGEDRSTIRAKNGPRVMAALRNFALGVLRTLGVQNIKRWVDCWSAQAERLTAAVCL